MLLVPQSQHHGWPAPSLESVFCAGSRTSSPRVQRLLYEWLEKSSTDPWESLIRRVESYLVERNLLIETRKETWLKRAEYTLSDHSDSRAEESVIQAIRELVDRCRSARPDVFSLLWRELGRAVSRRDLDAAVRRRPDQVHRECRGGLGREAGKPSRSW